MGGLPFRFLLDLSRREDTSVNRAGHTRDTLLNKILSWSFEFLKRDHLTAVRWSRGTSCDLFLTAYSVKSTEVMMMD